MYMLYKYKCPFHIQSTAHCLLLSFGYLINNFDLFAKYDSNFPICPTGLSTVEELNSMANDYVNRNLPNYSNVTWSSIISTYKGISCQIRDTYGQLRYTAKLISKVHDNDPSLHPEDIWVASSEERINRYAEIMGYNEKVDQRKELEYKQREVFWKWIAGVIDSVDDNSEVNTSAVCYADFESLVCE
jgi:hypothetical protein